MWLGVWEGRSISTDGVRLGLTLQSTENYRGQRYYEKGGYKRIGEHVFDVGGVRSLLHHLSNNAKPILQDAQTDWIMQKSLV